MRRIGAADSLLQHLEVAMAGEYQVAGQNGSAPFTLKVHRGDGMALVAMNWKRGRPPEDFVGFAVEYREPGGERFYSLNNRLSFPGGRAEGPNKLSTRLSPIQKFRWVHFPRNAELAGEFLYRVTPVFMNASQELSYGESQEAALELRRETYPGQLNVAFTRGYVSSQAFVDRYESKGPIDTLLPAKAKDGLTFAPTHPSRHEALRWMGFEARSAVLDVLDQAFGDKAQVRVVAYDLNEPEVVSRLVKLRGRLKIIIDDSDEHGHADSGETAAAERLAAAGAEVKRQHLGKLQHNKTIVVDGPKVQAVVCGSTNFSWRGLYVQANNVVVLRGASAVAPFLAAFEGYWASDAVSAFARSAASRWTDLGLDDIDARVTFSPMSSRQSALAKIAADVGSKTTSSLFYSLAFLYQTPGPMLKAIQRVTAQEKVFVYGMSDREVGGLALQKPNGNVAPVKPAALRENVPEPFRSEPTGGGGARMHHKFLVIDFDKPTARVYTGSYNFSATADSKNGENLLLIRDRRVAVSYTVEALRLFDAYHFRVAQQEAKKAMKRLALRPHPLVSHEDPWWLEDYTVGHKIRDRELFA
ncbi:MAG TPA: phospholipase D-like domain-containing protein [Anaeromyxobacter sp.]|nr:phospholipase D-like domain-containing protein [Anaeromyxobacter sp.]